MNFETKLKVYGSALGVLTLTALLGLFFNPQANFDRQSKEPLLAGFETDKVAGLDLGNGTTLTREGGAWWVAKDGQKFPGNTDKVPGFLKDLAALTKARTVSGGDDAASYGLATGFKTLVVQDKDGKPLYSLQIGKATPDERDVYVKFADQKTIYETDRSFARSLELDYNSWTDLRLFRTTLKPEQITQVEFKGLLTVNNKIVQPYTMVRTVLNNQPVWTLAGQNAPIPEGDTLASALANRQVTGYLLPSEVFDPAAAANELILTTDRGQKLTLKIGPKDAQNRFPLSDGERRLYLAEWSLDQLLYKAPNAPTVAPAPAAAPKK